MLGKCYTTASPMARGHIYLPSSHKAPGMIPLRESQAKVVMDFGSWFKRSEET